MLSEPYKCWPCIFIGITLSSLCLLMAKHLTEARPSAGMVVTTKLDMYFSPFCRLQWFQITHNLPDAITRNHQWYLKKYGSISSINYQPTSGRTTRPPFTTISVSSNHTPMIQSIMHTHYGDVIMGMMASQITSLTIVYSIIYWGADQRNIKAQCHWPLCKEFTGDRWISRTNGQ